MTPRTEVLIDNESHDCRVPTSRVLKTNFCYEMRGAIPPKDESRLRVNFKQLSEDCSSLLGTVTGGLAEGSSPTLDACRDALRTDMTLMLDEAKVLLQNLEEVTPWRASLAQARVLSYRETIQSALDSRHQLDSELSLVANSISSQINSETKTTDDLPFRVSSWRTPSLCFDLEVSEQVHFVRTEHMPIKIRVRAIAEIHAKDINASSIPKYSAFRVHVEQCKHDNQSLFPSAGALGEVLIKLRINRLGENQKKKLTWGGEDADVGFVRVTEARVVQKNAFPPLPKRTVDLYTSSHHGTSDTTVMLRFNTHRGRDVECVPEVDIEVVMASS
ncbi:hypothetical protein MHU86_3258 [Fragilaria crotonensis]|nr:hypothetical protein MHU86_3258 [Fragilaria crotonensis]